MALADTARLITSLELKDNFTRPLAAADRQLSAFQRSGEQIGHGIRQVGSGLTTLGIRAGVAAAGGLTAVVKTAIDFESAFAGVAKTVDATGPELAQLEQGFLDLSKTIPLSVEELEAIGEQAGALGIAKEDILDFTETVAKLGATTNVTSEQAATALGQLSNVLDLSAQDFDNFGAALVDLGNKGASTEAQILEIASRSGAGAGLIGIAADATLGWASAVANLGVQTEAGGSALQQFFLQSQKNLTITERLDLMAKTAGVSAKEFKKAFAEDASGALQQFLIGLNKLPAAARLSVLDDVNLKGIRLQRVLLGLAGDTDNLASSLDVASDAWDKNAALNEEFAKRAATTESALRVLVNNLRIAANTIGQELLPVLRDLSAEFVDFLNKPSTQRGIKDFAKGLADGIRGFVQQFKSGQFDGIIQSLKDAAGVMKIAFDAFNALPGPLKSALIAGAVVNRATGGALGLITSGLINITKGVGGLLSRGGSPATPLFVQQVGPGGLGPGGLLGGGGGLLSTLTRLAGAVGLMVAAAEGLKLLQETFDPNAITRKEEFDRTHGGIFNLFPEKVTVTSSTPIGQFVPENLGGTPVPQRTTQRGSGADTAAAAGIEAIHRDIQRALREGDIAEARRLREITEGLRLVRGKIDQRINDILPGIGRTNNALAVANRNLRDGNARQREVASRIREARDRLNTGFSEQNEVLRSINAKVDQPPVVNVTVPVNTFVSIDDIVRQSSTYAVGTSLGSQFGRGFTPR